MRLLPRPFCRVVPEGAHSKIMLPQGSQSSLARLVCRRWERGGLGEVVVFSGLHLHAVHNRAGVAQSAVGGRPQLALAVNLYHLQCEV